MNNHKTKEASLLVGIMIIQAHQLVDAVEGAATDAVEGTAVTMQVTNPQTIEVVTMQESGSNGWHHLDGGDGSYYRPSILGVGYDTSNRMPAAWGIKTNGRFLANIVHDFASIEASGSPMFGANPSIVDDFGNTVNYPAFIKYETDAAGKKYDGVEVSGDKRYEVLPAKFKVEVINLGSITGTASVTKVQWGGNFYYVEWAGTGQELAGISTTTDNHFSKKIGLLQVADLLGASQDNGNAYRTQYVTDGGNGTHTTIINNRSVAVFVGPEIDSSAAANNQPGTYYLGMKLTVVAQE